MALTSFYLLGAFPDKRIMLFGESEMGANALDTYDAIILPSFEISKLPDRSVDLAFNSYSLAEMSPETIQLFICELMRVVKTYILHVNHNKVSKVVADDFGIDPAKFDLLYKIPRYGTWGSTPTPTSASTSTRELLIEGDAMKVVILCGGLGTRLAEETVARPKPMVEIGGRPIVWHIMNIYASHGFKDFVLACGYKSEFIKDYFVNFAQLDGDIVVDLRRGKTETRNSRAPDWTIAMVDTGTNTQTGGRIKRLADWIGGSTFMLTYGDGVGSIDVRKLLDFHRACGKLATVTAVRPPAAFRRAQYRRGPRRRFLRKAAGRRRMGQRRVHGAGAGRARLHRRGRHLLGAPTHGTPRRRWTTRRLPPFGLLATDGYPARKATA